MATTLDTLVEMVFSRPPGDIASIPVCFVENTPEHTFPVLMDITTRGMAKLFGPSITIQTITENQQELLKKYILSIGYRLIHRYTYMEDTVIVNIYFLPVSVKTDCHGIKRVKID